MPDQVQNTLSWVEIETSRAAQIETMGRIYRTRGCLPTDPVPRCFWKRAALLYVAESRCWGLCGFRFAGAMRLEQRRCITASIRSGRHHKNVRMEYATVRLGLSVLVCWDQPEDPRMACRYTQAITGMRTGVWPEPQIAATQWRAAVGYIGDSMTRPTRRTTNFTWSPVVGTSRCGHSTELWRWRPESQEGVRL